MDSLARERKWIGGGAALAMVGVALGAFGAHGLRGRVPVERLDVYQTGVYYHVIHALAILLVVALAGRIGANWPRVAWLFAVGIVVFGGTLYALAITDISWLGAITPLGGICFMGGWTLLSFTVWKGKQ